MGYQSKTWSLSDEVVAVFEMARANGESPNQFLRRLLRIGKDADRPHATGCTLPTDHLGICEREGQSGNE